MSVTHPMGWSAAGVVAGTKPSGRPDLALVVSDRPATVAGAFTPSGVPSAHVQLCRPRVARGAARAVCVSAGCANAFTGQAGVADAERMAKVVASRVGVPADEVLVAATGTIGTRLDMDRIEPAIDAAADRLGPDGGEAAAAAICTTDAAPKMSTRTLDVGSGTVRIGAMAKGAGMIAPRMVPQGTLLAFVTTDAAAPAAWLRETLEATLPTTLNAITVDGCMSTSDTTLLLANGASGIGADATPGFRDAVREVLAELAYAVVSDGEGASRVVRVRVTGAASADDATRVAREIATSMLVRCAMAGDDPNHGRIVQAVGQAPVTLDPGHLTVSVQGVVLSRGGCATGRDAEASEALARGGDALIEADLGAGSAAFEYLTCDLTTEYVTFNSRYTT